MITNFDTNVIASCVSLSRKVQKEFKPVADNIIIDEEDDFLRSVLWMVSETAKTGVPVWVDDKLIVDSINNVKRLGENTTGYSYLRESFCAYFQEFTYDDFDSLVVLSCIESLNDLACDVMSRGSRRSVAMGMEIEHSLTDLYTEYQEEWTVFTGLQKQIADVFSDSKYYGFLQYCSIVTPSKFWGWAEKYALVTKCVKKNGAVCYKAVSDDKTRDYKSLVSKGLGSIANFGLLSFIVSVFVGWYSLTCSKVNIVMEACGESLSYAMRGEVSTEVITDACGSVAKAYVKTECINETAFEKFQRIGLFTGLNYKTATGKQLFEAVRLSLRGFQNYTEFITLEDVIKDPLKVLSLLDYKEGNKVNGSQC